MNYRNVSLAHYVLLTFALMPNNGHADESKPIQIPIEQVADERIKAFSDRVVVLYDKKQGLPKGAFCSGFLARYKTDLFLFTVEHCIPDSQAMDCTNTAIVPNYTRARLNQALDKIIPDDGTLLSKMHRITLDLGVDADTRFIGSVAFDSLNCENKVFSKVHFLGPNLTSDASDIAVYRVGGNSKETVPAFNLKDLSRPIPMDLFRNKGFILGHPGGRPLEASLNCSMDMPSNDHLVMDSDCIAFPGNSGSPVFLDSSGIPVGLTSGTYEFNGSVRSHNGYIRTFAEALIEYMNGNTYAGFTSMDGSLWTELKGTLAIKLLDRSPTPEQLKLFKSFASFLDQKIHRDYKVEQSEFVLVRIEKSDLPPSWPLIYINDPPNVIDAKLQRIFVNHEH